VVNQQLLFMLCSYLIYDGASIRFYSLGWHRTDLGAGIETEKGSFDDAEKAAQSHAWDYFSFHAQQRQTVFNFFIIPNGASLAAFAATIDKPGGGQTAFRDWVRIGNFQFLVLETGQEKPSVNKASGSSVKGNRTSIDSQNGTGVVVHPYKVGQ
jgi:hypothetical protein